MEYLTNNYVLFAIGATFIGFAVFLLKDIFAFNSYVRRSKLLTPAEQNFYAQLMKAVNGKAHIMCMVRVADVVDIKSSVQGKRRMHKLGPIAQKHFDFVLVDRETNILCAIELNDKSHEQQDRKKRDEFLTKLMESVGLPLLKVKAAKSYDTNTIRRYLNAHLPMYFPADCKGTK